MERYVTPALCLPIKKRTQWQHQFDIYLVTIPLVVWSWDIVCFTFFTIFSNDRWQPFWIVSLWNKRAMLALNRSPEFNSSEPKTQYSRAFWYPRPCFEQNMQSSIPNYKHLSQVVLKQKIFFILTMYFYASNPGAPGARPFWTLWPIFWTNLLSPTRQCYKPNFKHLRQVVLKKIIEYLTPISMFELRTLWGGAILYPRATIGTNLVEEHQTKLHIKFQTSKQSGSEEDFEFFLFISMVWT